MHAEGILQGPYPQASICRTEPLGSGNSFPTLPCYRTVFWWLTTEHLVATDKYLRPPKESHREQNSVCLLNISRSLFKSQQLAWCTRPFFCCREKQTTKYQTTTIQSLFTFLMEHTVNCHWLRNGIMELRLASAELRSQSPDWKRSAAPLIRARAWHPEHQALSPHPQTAFPQLFTALRFHVPFP